MNRKGIALVLSLLLLLLLTLFAFTVLLLAASYYSSGRNLFWIQDSRLACESALKRIIDRHSGRIWVESKPGEGSTFHFTLPQNTVR